MSWWLERRWLALFLLAMLAGCGTQTPTTQPSSFPTAVPPDRGYYPQDLAFTGAVSGHFGSALVQPPCRTLSHSDAEYPLLDVTFAGLLLGSTMDDRYVISLTLQPFIGAGTYVVTQGTSNVVVEIANRDTVDDFVASGGRVVVGHDELSGTLDLDFDSVQPGDRRSVHVSGSWKCGGSSPG